MAPHFYGRTQTQWPHFYETFCMLGHICSGSKQTHFRSIWSLSLSHSALTQLLLELLFHFKSFFPSLNVETKRGFVGDELAQESSHSGDPGKVLEEVCPWLQLTFLFFFRGLTGRWADVTSGPHSHESNEGRDEDDLSDISYSRFGGQIVVLAGHFLCPFLMASACRVFVGIDYRF